VDELTAWHAAEDFISPDPEQRRAALKVLLEHQAARKSTLIAYLLVSRLTEPDLELRSAIITALANILIADDSGNPATENVRRILSVQLGQMRQRQVYALLQVIVYNPEYIKPVDCLLDLCSYAGSHLGDILSERIFPLDIREQAARAIGRVGYLDALPVLERMVTRLEARSNGQKTLPFISPGAPDEINLLPAVREALHCLKEP
jgi:hypothetical protein